VRRRHITDADPLLGYDTLRIVQNSTPDRDKNDWSFTPNRAYNAYFRMQKGLASESEGKYLEGIANSLDDEWMPGYLTVAGWAAAEAALVQRNQSTAKRMQLIDQAVSSWERAMISQEQINRDSDHEWLLEDDALYRQALNLAFVPLMKSLVAGNITGAAHEKTFADTLALAQASIVQRSFAQKHKNIDAVWDHSGFIHECNALLTLLYMDDHNYLPLPSPTRTGAGYGRGDQTHDILVIDQHRGDIRNIVPIEMKAAASSDDFERYLALIVQGRVDLVAPGKSPQHTIDAYAAMYEDRQTAEDRAIVDHVISTMRSLLQAYQKSEPVRPHGTTDTSKTTFHRQTRLPEGDNLYFFDRSRWSA
jgi:hypothetical protein